MEQESSYIKIVGDPSTFAIGCKNPVGRWFADFTPKEFAVCQFIVDNRAVGDESGSWVKIWHGSLCHLIKEIKEKNNTLYINEFDGLRPDEILELVIKSNQFEEEQDPAYAYLPTLDNDIWGTFKIWLDETTDRVDIVFYVLNDSITVIVKNVDNGTNTVFSACIALNEFLSIAEEFCKYLETEFHEHLFNPPY